MNNTIVMQFPIEDDSILFDNRILYIISNIVARPGQSHPALDTVDAFKTRINQALLGI
jgi:hypothetical protein